MNKAIFPDIHSESELAAAVVIKSIKRHLPRCSSLLVGDSAKHRQQGGGKV